MSLILFAALGALFLKWMPQPETALAGVVILSFLLVGLV